MSKYCEDLFGDLLLKQPLETHPVSYLVTMCLFLKLAIFERDEKNCIIPPIVELLMTASPVLSNMTSIFEFIRCLLQTSDLFSLFCTRLWQAAWGKPFP